MIGSPKSELVVFYTTFESEIQGLPIIRDLLKNNLIACANFFPIESVYHWKGEIEESQEMACFLKTSSLQSQALKEFLLKNHPYDVPCLIDMRVENLNVAYLKWALEEMKGHGKRIYN